MLQERPYHHHCHHDRDGLGHPIRPTSACGRQMLQQRLLQLRVHGKHQTMSHNTRITRFSGASHATYLQDAACMARPTHFSLPGLSELQGAAVWEGVPLIREGMLRC